MANETQKSMAEKPVNIVIVLTRAVWDQHEKRIEEGTMRYLPAVDAIDMIQAGAAFKLSDKATLEQKKLHGIAGDSDLDGRQMIGYNQA